MGPFLKKNGIKRVPFEFCLKKRNNLALTGTYGFSNVEYTQKQLWKSTIFHLYSDPLQRTCQVSIWFKRTQS